MTDPMEYDMLGAYVLDALDDDERARFERLLEQSPEMSAEVVSLREAVATLGALDEQTPPVGLKHRVMAQVDLVEQVPATAPDGLEVGPDLTDEPDEDTVVSLDDARRERQRSSVMTRLGLAAGAIAAGIAVVLGLSLAQLNARVDSIERTADQVAAVVAAEDAVRISVPVLQGGVLSAVVSAEDGAAIVVGRELAALRDGEIYALWTINRGVAVPVGRLIDGEAIAVRADFELIGLTMEPDGPLDQPTGEILALLEA